MRQALEQRVDRVAELPFGRRRKGVAPDPRPLRDRYAADVDFIALSCGDRRIHPEHACDALGVEVIARDAQLDLETIYVALDGSAAGRVGHPVPLAAAAPTAWASWG